MKKITVLSLFLFLSSLNAAEYSREEFGHGWIDEDRDCLDTRQEILIRDAIEIFEIENCRVIKGWWILPYSGEITDDPRNIDIDHKVPLKWSWENGANEWRREKRIQFANDPDNLIAVSASQNRSKGAKGPCEWMPEDESYHDVYIQQWNDVVRKYWND